VVDTSGEHYLIDAVAIDRASNLPLSNILHKRDNINEGPRYHDEVTLAIDGYREPLTVDLTVCPDAF
jgi:hypothetical protein